MKRCVHRYLCGILLLIGIALVNVSAKDVYPLGDANGDGKVDAADVVEILNSIRGKSSDKFDIDLADINEDGHIDMTDVDGVSAIIIGRTEAKARRIDTVRVRYHDDHVSIGGTYNSQRIKTTIQGIAALSIVSTWKRPFVCIAEGKCPDGSLKIEADTTCTLVLDNLELSSSESAAVCLPMKQKVSIELSKGSHNILIDASGRNKDEESVNGCLYSKGTLTFTGEGALTVTGNYRHGILSSKNISVEGSHLVINNVVKNGIHCDKFTLKKGQVDLHLQNAASKGIKTKEELIVKGGSIEGDATGGITIESGDVSYCALLKSDGTMSVSDGAITLKHRGEGGRCISVDGNMDLTGGLMSLECYGDGGKYTNEDGVEDYYTPKGITVDDSLFINSGTITCLSTGLGGKGIVAGRFLSIGCEERDENTESPLIRVETKGECIINNEDEDLRFGCPKGIKSDSTLIIYDGDIAVTTAGMGGEGVECNGKMYIKGGTLECNTFDDGINVGKSIEISGGQVYCNSVDNDGIDSNGSITISGGVVASVNQKKPNESFDSDGGQFYIDGGIVFGIGSGPVDVKTSLFPCYSTPIGNEDEPIRSKGLILTKGKYVCVQKGNKVIMALLNDNQAFRSFVTVMHPSLSNNELLSIGEGDCPLDSQQSYFSSRLLLFGLPNNVRLVAEIQVKTIQ